MSGYRRALRLAAALSIAALSTGCSFVGTPVAVGEGIENVILLSVDTVGKDALSSEALPALDGLASRAVVFDNAFSAASWTLPSHASLLTALYPDRHGAFRAGRRLSKDQTTLEKLLHAAGYETVAFTGGGYMSGAYGFGRGFDRYDGWVASKSWRPELRLPWNGTRDGRLFDRAIAYLENVGDDDPPFFLLLHTYYVHDYFKNERGNETDESLKPCLADASRCSLEQWRELRALYREKLRGFDRGLSRLVATLERTHLFESTLFVLTSDHGEGFDPENGRIHHGGRLDPGQLHVPLMFVGPHLAPRTVADNVSLVDVMPTILELLGVSDEADFDGVSFVESLYGRDQARKGRRNLFAMEYAHRWEEGVKVDVKIRDDVPALVAVIRATHQYVRDGDSEEIFDLRSETEASLPASADALVSFRKAVVGRARFAAAGQTMELDDELREQLRSLGYIP